MAPIVNVSEYEAPEGVANYPSPKGSALARNKFRKTREENLSWLISGGRSHRSSLRGTPDQGGQRPGLRCQAPRRIGSGCNSAWWSARRRCVTMAPGLRWSANYRSGEVCDGFDYAHFVVARPVDGPVLRRSRSERGPRRLLTEVFCLGLLASDRRARTGHPLSGRLSLAAPSRQQSRRSNIPWRITRYADLAPSNRLAELTAAMPLPTGSFLWSSARAAGGFETLEAAELALGSRELTLART